MLPVKDGRWKLEGNKTKMISNLRTRNILQGPGMEAMEFMAPYHNKETKAEAAEVSLRLLDIEVTGLCCGPEAASWVSRFLGEECRLVQHTLEDSTRRRTRAKYVKERLDHHDCDSCVTAVICAGLPPDLP